MAVAHNNQQVFSDHYLNVSLPERVDWQSLSINAQPVMESIAALFKKYKPGGKEAQAEYRLVRPVLEALGHTFEVQASLATPDGTKTPDYIFYRNEEALEENKGQRLNDTLLQGRAFAVGDAKYWDCPLDIAVKVGTDPFTNKNPSYQIAFYIQHSGLEWGILTNGRLWRLYHKNTAHKLDHYYEVDLPALLKSGDVQQFLYFYAFFHRSAFEAHPLSVSAILKESLDYAQGISDSLKRQVYEALRYVSQGFLDHPANKLVPENATTLKEIYDNSLILLYRLLFILYAEARDLLPMSASNLYAENYSLRSMTRSLAKDLDAGRILRSGSTRLYYQLKELFGFINVGDPPLNISTFNGGLFDPQRHPFLERYELGDARLQQAIDMLARVNRQFIDYRDLSVRNLGTIYEGLLEYHLEPIADDDGWSIDLLNDKGERKATGSFYTPDYIVKYIVDATVGPLLQAAMNSAPMPQTTANDTAKIEAVLAIKVLDPSMGSGHFLVETTEYIARFLVEQNVQPEKLTKEAELAYWKRRVVQSCVYGVDLNPLAVELAKLSLWLSTVAKDRPLSFLDHHLRTGNALFGVRFADLTQARNGNGHGSHSSHGPARKTRKPEPPKEQLALFDDDLFRQNMTTAVDLMWLVEDSPAQTIAQVKEQEQLYATMREGLVGKYGRLADLLTSRYFGTPIDANLLKPLADYATGRSAIPLAQFKDWLDEATMIAKQRAFFHWELEFPEVFFDKHGQPKKEQAGFDAVVGNPPWIRQEMFSRDKAALGRLYRVYHGVADLSTYFVELGNSYLKVRGRFGFIVPNKFLRANYGEALRRYLSQQVLLERIVNFGDLPVFAEAVTYPLILLTSKQSPDQSPVKYTHLKTLPNPPLADAIEANATLVSRSTLANEHWSLESNGTQSIVEKMQTNSIPLGQFVHGKLYRGILTGLNEAFVIDRRTRNALIAQDSKSAEIIKPFVVGRDIKRYRVDFQERYIILTRIGTPIERYPAIFAHLQRFQSKLEARWDKGNHWWELRSCDYYEEFEKPKIIFPDIAKSSQFAIDSNGFYTANTTYIMPTESNQFYLVALLNSPLIEFFFQSISAFIRGDYLRFIFQYVTQIPIRSIAFTTPQEERTALVNKAIAIFTGQEYERLYAFVDERLAQQPEQSDVVHDLLAYLAEQMITLTAQRQEQIADFFLTLEGLLSRASLEKLARLWTPLIVSASINEFAAKLQEEANHVLGPLAAQTLDLSAHLGILDEEQWKWLLKRRLKSTLKGTLQQFPELVKAFRKYQPTIAALENQMHTTEHAINQLVYRLYGLSSDEIATIEHQ